MPGHNSYTLTQERTIKLYPQGGFPIFYPHIPANIVLAKKQNALYLKDQRNPFKAVALQSPLNTRFAIRYVDHT